MRVRLIAAGVALLAMIGMLAVMVRVSSQTRQVHVLPQNHAALARVLHLPRDRSPAGLDPGWVVVKANSAHRAMVVEVQAHTLDDARSIAEQIVEPARIRGYQEILVYVQGLNGGIDAPMRRVQWTPKGGFVETRYGVP